MCIYKDCPIFDKCDKEIDQVLYCRHVEMIKKLAKLRADLKRQQAAANQPTNFSKAGNVVSIHSGRNQQNPADERTASPKGPFTGLRGVLN